MALLSDRHRAALLRYQYHGGDPSMLYKFVLSPIAEYFVLNWTPSWVAPNLITLLGLLSTIIATILVFIFNPELNGSCPGWVMVVIGVAILFYQTMDNMDGKQARRTKSSSPLGLLFDHGCDAINASLLAICMGSVFATGWTTKLFLGYFIGYVPFYIQTWEEYYTGSMILPAFNGPSEGLVMIALFSFYSAYHGASVWQERIITLPEALTSTYITAYITSDQAKAMDIYMVDSTIMISPFQAIVVVGSIWSSLTLIIQIRTVILEAHKRKVPMIRPLLDLLPITVYFMTMFIWCTVSDIAFHQHPYITAMLMSSIFVEIVVHVMVMHIADGETEPMKRYLAYGTPSLLIASTMTSSSLFGRDTEKAILFVYSISATIITVYKLYRICKEVSDALDINIFTLGKKGKRK